MNVRRALFLALACVGFTLSGYAKKTGDEYSRFVGLEDFSNFTKTPGTNIGETILISPEIEAPIPWTELVVSWNMETPKDAYVKVDARTVVSNRPTQFYTLGLWSRDAVAQPRQSLRKQKDENGRISTDTLIMNQPVSKVQVRITFGGKSEAAKAKLKYLGFSFCNPAGNVVSNAPNKSAWGKIIDTPERSQNSYPQEQGWCSPTSLSMVLTRWANVLDRPEMAQDVPVVAENVYDKNFGTGNWPFNTAYAGSFDGMRSYITRLSSISELEDWVAAGIPVIISSPWHLLEDGRKDTGSGHVVTVIGFTKEGDVVINDPASRPEKGRPVKHIYKRANVIKAWKTSNNTVYLVYPVKAKIPKPELGQWDKR